MRCRGSRVSVTAFDPGLVPGTGLTREQPFAMRFIVGSVMPRMLPLLRAAFNANTHTPAESGGNLARLAVGAGVEGVSGRYFEEGREEKSSALSYDEGKQEDLWRWTVGFVARGEEEKRRFDNLGDLK